MSDIAPFKVVETTPGKFSLLLTEFDPAAATFEKAGLQGGGYSWEGIARHVTENVDASLQGRLGLDPEGSMFCAYGEDRGALEALGGHLARLFHDPAALAAAIETIGVENFDD